MRTNNIARACSDSRLFKAEYERAGVTPRFGYRRGKRVTTTQIFRRFRASSELYYATLPTMLSGLILHLPRQDERSSNPFFPNRPSQE